MRTKNMKMRGQRNNNPLNIKYVKTTIWVGQVRDIERSDKVFVEFTEMKYGIREILSLENTKENMIFFWYFARLFVSLTFGRR